jgi:hypothetical protein
MFNPQTPQQRHWQNSIVAAGLVGASASVLTLVLMGLVFMFAGDIRYGQPLAMFVGHLHMTPFMMPQGTLAGAAWLMLAACYAGLLVGLPAFLIINWGGPDAN